MKRIFEKLKNGLLYSLAGLKTAFKDELAFRIEIAVAAVAIPAGLILGDTPSKQALLVGGVFLVLIAELLNTAIEAMADKISPRQDPLIKKAKDAGSAAVFLAALAAVFIWGVVLWDDLFPTQSPLDVFQGLALR